MNENVLNKLIDLKEKDSIFINSKFFEIKERLSHNIKHDDFIKNIIRFELNDGHVLELDGGNVFFFKIIKKRNLFGFITTRSVYENIKKIEFN